MLNRQDRLWHEVYEALPPHRRVAVDAAYDAVREVLGETYGVLLNGDDAECLIAAIARYVHADDPERFGQAAPDLDDPHRYVAAPDSTARDGEYARRSGGSATPPTVADVGATLPVLRDAACALEHADPDKVAALHRAADTLHAFLRDAIAKAGA